MYISLRKAAALQKEILSAIENIDTTAVVSVYEEDVNAILTAKEVVVLVKLNERNALMDALFEIRDLTAIANVAHGITSLVAQKARLEKDITLYTKLANSSPRQTTSVVNGRIQKVRASDNAYAHTENLCLDVLGENTIALLTATAAEMKKEKVEVQDQLLELNIKHNIDLSDGSVAVLTAKGLL
jgi:beta-glucosidase/6-phospho-beta-glucosidase/beta-galactosidase